MSTELSVIKSPQSRIHSCGDPRDQSVTQHRERMELSPIKALMSHFLPPHSILPMLPNAGLIK